MTDRKNSTCPECGVDSWIVKDHDKLLSEKLEIAYRFKTASANHALLQAEWTLREISLTESMKYLQRKTLKQTKIISRMEERIKKLGQQPYKEDEPEKLVKLSNGKLVIEES